MKKNEVVILTIENYGDGGEGVARVDGMAVFIPFAMIGEVCEVVIILVKKNYAIGKIQKIIEKAQGRCEPFCSVFGKCGGCQIQHMDKDAQSDFKRKKVQDCMSRIGFIQCQVEETVVGEKTRRYRNKLQLPLADNNGLVGGFYAPFSHRMVEINDCEIQDEESLSVFHALRLYSNLTDVKAYDERSHKGLLRHLVVRNSQNGMLITIVINGNFLPQSDVLIREIDKLGLNYGLYINENTEMTNVITSEKYTHLTGLKELDQNDDGLEYSVMPQSFLQVNEEIKDEIYQRAVVEGEIAENDVVVNAYSGAGLLTAYFAKISKFCYGIEIIAEATASADKLAKDNGLVSKMKNVTGDCKEVLKKLIPKLKKQRALDLELGKKVGSIIFVLDPPRKGVDSDILEELLKLLPDKIIYISCNPASLARDVGVLVGNLEVTSKGLIKTEDLKKNSKYKVKSVTPYDMFPQTKHVEALCVLELN